VPSHGFHLNVDLMFIGVQYPGVHRILDIYAKAIGPNHRQWFHNDDAVAYMCQVGGIYAAWSAWLHIVTDRVADRVGADACIAELVLLASCGAIPLPNAHAYPPPLLGTY